MSAGIYNMTCDQGATFQQTLYWKGSDGALIDLTGYSARMQVRSQVAVPSPQVAVTLELTTENGRIALGGSAGTISLTVKSTATAAVSAGTYYYDLELISNDSPQVVTRLVQGEFVVVGEVTR